MSQHGWHPPIVIEPPDVNVPSSFLVLELPVVNCDALININDDFDHALYQRGRQQVEIHQRQGS